MAAGEAVIFDAGASKDADGVIINYAWDFGDGNTSEGLRPAHRFAEAGTYRVALTVTDDAGVGNSRVTREHEVVVNPAPVADLEAPQWICPAVELPWAVDVPSGTEVAWIFGDTGVRAEGANVTYQFANSGLYPVSVALDDGKNLANSQRREERYVRVNAAPTAGDDALATDQDMALSVNVAADLLGNLYFERGEFEQAQASWQAILDTHPGTSLPEVELQFKRVVAYHRAGMAQEAHALAEQVSLRFAGREVAYAGGRVDAAQALRDLLGAAPADESAVASDATVPAGLPAEGDAPLWQMTFASDATTALFQNTTNRRNYYGPTDLRLLTPPAAADGRAVYAHWHGVAFAMDLDTGKLLWRNGSFNEAGRNIQQRMGSATGTPRGYKIALTDRLVLVQSAGQGAGGQPFDRFTLTALDKQTGETVWDSGAMPDWRGHSFCGQPLVVRGQAYVITHPAGAIQQEGQTTGNARSLTLHRIDASTGRPQWSLPLGDVDVQANPYIQSVWMPQPTLLLHDRALFVLTNNGAVMAVDTGAGEVAWAARLRAPEGVGNQENRNFYNIQPPSANVQGAGDLFLRQGVLYVKEARSPRIYAFDPDGPTLLWERPAPADAALIGVDEELDDQRRRKLAPVTVWKSTEEGERWLSDCASTLRPFLSPPPRVYVVESSGGGYIAVVAVPRSHALVACEVKQRLVHFFRLHDKTLEVPSYLVEDLVLVEVLCQLTCWTSRPVQSTTNSFV